MAPDHAHREVSPLGMGETAAVVRRLVELTRDDDPVVALRACRVMWKLVLLGVEVDGWSGSGRG